MERLTTRQIKKTGSDISHELMAGENACLTGTGDIHQDGHTWFDGCRQCYCHKGKEMCALIICPVPSCPNPFISHGQCCPRCVSGAGTTSLNEVTMTVCQAVDGNYYVEGETWRINKCTECICHEGHVLCEVQSCPPVPCTKPIYLEGQCCASCQRVAQKSAENEVDTPCLSEDGLIKYDDGATWQLTSCRSCICNHGNVECYSQDCPQVTCNRPVHRKNQCCPVCLDSVVGYACEFANSIYNNEDKWNVDECTSCVCLNGQVMCTKKLCNTRCDNPIEVIGQCCPLCRDDDNASDATNGSKAEGNVIYVPTKTIRNDANDKDVRRPFAKPQPKTSYVTVICVTIITLLVISITLLTICCWKQRKKLRYYEHESSIGSKTRPKSANMDYQGALTAFLDQKPNCNSFYTEKTCDCDFKIGGHFNTYSAPPIRSAV
ncbi:CRIM1 (predicted) [Pycnogonum litorale]